MKSTNKSINERNITTLTESSEVSVDYQIKNLEVEMQRIRSKNNTLRQQKELSENQYYLIMNENNVLQIKLQNLGIFVICRASLRGQPDSEGDEDLDPVLRER